MSRGRGSHKLALDFDFCGETLIAEGVGYSCHFTKSVKKEEGGKEG